MDVVGHQCPSKTWCGGFNQNRAEPLYEAIPDYRREVDELIVSGSALAMRWRLLGTGRNGPFEVPAASFGKVENGKIVEGWVYIDTQLFLSASGLGPANP